ncbi:hypothetical protein Q9L42_020180 (plasmid) [Methylomarinum sp. Ch1-1]|uniref:Uncharacterized protein n=1 Tax=Methylomarinum roseum TaxID=3067653 RepID=A0AAU7P0B2_9GAMM|nr:hypothetical protein [Methylomarinum sp. Ch1-1]MDP4523232.1 hypothetical protein [Methylomarinum sp. Ch1-1]
MALKRIKTADKKTPELSEKEKQIAAAADPVPGKKIKGVPRHAGNEIDLRPSATRYFPVNMRLNDYELSVLDHLQDKSGLDRLGVLRFMIRHFGKNVPKADGLLNDVLDQ